MAEPNNMKGSFDPLLAPFWLAKTFSAQFGQEHVLVGIDEDDCAVIDLDGICLVVTTDYVNAKPIALELGIGSYRDIGYLCVTTNISDLCGTGARPVGFLASVMMKRGDDEAQYQELMSGIQEALSIYGVPLIGGDTKIGHAMAIGGTALGTAGSVHDLFIRNHALPGDDIWVSGPLGSCNAALIGLKEGFGDELWRSWARNAILRPLAPMRKIAKLYGNRGINAGTDISDGLGADLSTLCLSSKVGGIVDIDAIPTVPEVLAIALENNRPSWHYVFGAGGDFQLILTATPEISQQLLNLEFTKIGVITESPELVLRFADGITKPFPNHGHNDAFDCDFYMEISDFLKNTI